MINLIHGEAIETMRNLADKGIVFDAVICDPPYGVFTKSSPYQDKQGIDWDVCLDSAEMWGCLKNLVRENGNIILFCNEPYTSELVTSAINDIPFCTKSIWLKNNTGNPLGVKKNVLSVTEDILLFRVKYDTLYINELRKYFRKVLKYIGLNLKGINDRLGHRKAEHSFYVDSTQFKLCNEMVYNELIINFHIDKMNGFLQHKTLELLNEKYKTVFNLNGRNRRTNVFEYAKETGYHPTQKPVALLKDLIELYTNKGDFILDFTMGSGSTGLACLETERAFLGIEKSEKYYKIAKNRIFNLTTA